MAHARDHRGFLGSLNRGFDRVALAEIRIADRIVSSFLVAAGVGGVAGAVLFIALTAVVRADVLVGFGLVPIALVTSVLWALIRKRRAGIETWVLLEHLAVGLAAILGTLALVDEPMEPWLDRAFAGYCVIFAWGRIGCTTAGCCYGARCTVGIDYGPSHVAPGRRLPVALIEAALWMVCAALTVCLMFVAVPGVAFAISALLYAVLRFVLESLRDDARPRLLGLSESRWLACALGAGAILVLDRAGCVSRTSELVGGAGLLVAVLLWATAAHWLVVPPALDAALRGRLVAFGRTLAEVGPDAQVHAVNEARVRTVASWLQTDQGFELYVSTSAHEPAVMGPVEAALALEHVAAGLGIRGETPDVVETGPGHYVARFARDEIHFVKRSRVEPRPDELLRYLSPTTPQK